MMQYLVILLDDTSVSFCHYHNRRTDQCLMPLETLRAGIRFGMKQNLNIQFVYPDYELPEDYQTAIETIDHIKIKPVAQADNADVVVLNGINEISVVQLQGDVAYVLRLTKEEFGMNLASIVRILGQIDRLNVVITDVETFKEADFEAYKASLASLAQAIGQEYLKGRSPQLNILTDRMMLDGMNNCGAGDTTITLAPDGKFYVCPAFYQAEDGFAVGSLEGDVCIKNAQLYKLNHAPLCRNCDAYQCRRCVWLNRKTTLEVNTPSHEQCVVAHLERNASRQLLLDIRKHGTFLPERDDIREIDYLDPFDVRKEW